MATIVEFRRRPLHETDPPISAIASIVASSRMSSIIATSGSARRRQNDSRILVNCAHCRQTPARARSLAVGTLAHRPSRVFNSQRARDGRIHRPSSSPLVVAHRCRVSLQVVTRRLAQRADGAQAEFQNDTRARARATTMARRESSSSKRRADKKTIVDS